jgi:beta-galactosidase
VDLSLEIEHNLEESKKITLLTEVLSAQGAVIASKRTTLSAVKAGLHSIAQQIVLEKSHLMGY